MTDFTYFCCCHFKNSFAFCIMLQNTNYLNRGMQGHMWLIALIINQKEKTPSYLTNTGVTPQLLSGAFLYLVDVILVDVNVNNTF